MWTGTPVKANALDRAGDGQTSAPDFCIFTLSPGSPASFLRRTHAGKHTCKNEHPGRRRQQTAFRSRFPYLHIVPCSPAVFLRRTHVGSHARKRQTPRTAQAAARLTSLISASPCGPVDREDFCGQCAPDSPIWISVVTSSEMVYPRAAPPSGRGGAFC